MEFARALDLLELRLDASDAFLDHASIGFDLGFARPAEKAEAATLAFKMGPGAHQPALLVGQMRQLDLQGAFAGAGTPAEDFQDQSGAIEHLRAPGLFEITLLHRRERAIHHHYARVIGFDQAGNLLDLALADESRGANAAQGYDSGRDHVEINGASEPCGFIEPRIWRAQFGFGACGCADRYPRAQVGLDHERTARLTAFRRAQPVAAAIEPARFQSNLFRGGRLLGAFEQLDRMTRHNRRDRVLVDELGMPVASQQDAEIIEPGHYPLQLDPVHQEDRERGFVLTDVVEEGILQIL